MKLQRVRVQNYKSIFDSTEFSIGGVTCLVGKNEAGKTALLEALTKLNPVSGPDAYVALYEYPRSQLADAERTGADKKDPVLTTEWLIEDEDRAAVREALGIDPIISPTVTISKNYDGDTRYWSFKLDEKKLVREVLTGAGLTAEERKTLGSKATIEALVAALDEATEKSAGAAELLESLNEMYEDNTADDAVMDLLEERLPQFAYFGTYDQMRGQVSINELLLHKQRNELSRSEEVFIALLELAGTSPEDLQQLTTFEALRARLEAVSSRISREVFEYWSQNRYLRVQFSLDEGLPGDSPPFNAGKIFRTRIFNPIHDVSIGFDERSTGFVWFFSFLAWFSQVRKHLGQNLVLLLDEPGLGLHAKAQADLLRYINERLRPTFQLIYTTHSAFMVDTENLGEVRLVEDVFRERIEVNGRVIQEQEILGTKVSQRVLAANAETLFPLQAALGLDITQSLFVGRHNLLVEGASDLLYLKWFSRELQSAGRIGLDPRWVLAPVGGVDKMGSFAALFGGNKLDVCALVDVHAGIKKKVEDLEKHPALRPGHILRVPKYLGGQTGDIEDLIGPEGYEWLVNRAYALGGSNAVRVPPDSERVVTHVEDAFAVMPQPIPGFDHFRPAEYLSEHSDEVRKEMPGLEQALNRFEQLFKDCNALLEAGSPAAAETHRKGARSGAQRAGKQGE